MKHKHAPVPYLGRDSFVHLAQEGVLQRRDGKLLLFVWFAVLVAFALVQAGSGVAAGAWYLFLSVAVVLIKPGLGLALILAGVPLTYNVSPGGGNLSIAEVALLVTGIRAVTTGRAKIMAVILPIAAYLFICMLSSALVFRGHSAIMSWLQMVIYLVLTVVTFSVYGRDTKAVIVALTAMVGTSAVLGMLLVMDGGGYVFGIHKNSIGATTAASLVVAVEMWFRTATAENKGKRRVWMLAIAILSFALLFSLSRGAWGSAVIGVLILIALRGRWGLLLRLVIALIPLMTLGVLMLPEGSTDYIAGSINTESHSYGTRANNAAIAWSFFTQNPLLGMGLGLRKQYDATNIVLFTLAETGLVGLGAFLMIHFKALRIGFRARRQIDLRSPMFSVVALSMALLFGRLAHGLVDHYWSRGAVTVAWAMVGAMLAVVATLKMRRTQQPELGHFVRHPTTSKAQGMASH